MPDMNLAISDDAERRCANIIVFKSLFRSRFRAREMRRTLDINKLCILCLASCVVSISRSSNGGVYKGDYARIGLGDATVLHAARLG